LRDADLSKRDRDNYFETISRNGKALTRIVDDILDLAKVESGKMDVEAVEVELNDLVRESIALFEEIAKEKGIRLTVSTDANVPRSVCTDPTRVRQIILNLVGNAVKFTAEGSVDVRVQAETLNQRTKRISIFVDDTGIGIDPENQVRLFQPFAQADSSTTRRFGGTGLGLALSLRLARALKGEVKLLPKTTRGSTFVFSFEAALPRSEQTALDSHPSSNAQTSPSSATSDLAGREILIVDDSGDNRMLLKRVLERAGITTAQAANGKEAVDQAKQKKFDLIFMDVQMPEMDGYEATRILRASGYDRKIVALSAHAMKEDHTRSLAAGCNAHLTKPINQTELLRAIRELLEL
jgi:CheY-like chemotaxis protein